ncbi:hypothetical protein [Caballeronia pedi]|nr:hypothetical protein [Caballeronia pedi]
MLTIRILTLLASQRAFCSQALGRHTHAVPGSTEGVRFVSLLAASIRSAPALLPVALVVSLVSGAANAALVALINQAPRARGDKLLTLGLRFAALGVVVLVIRVVSQMLYVPRTARKSAPTLADDRPYRARVVPGSRTMRRLPRHQPAAAGSRHHRRVLQKPAVDRDAARGDRGLSGLVALREGRLLMCRDTADIVDPARLAAIYGVPMSVTTDAAIGRRVGFAL